MRHGLLMTAVATVTVPGLLAMLAVRAHEHVSAEAAVAVAGADGTALSGPFPVAGASARAGAGDNIAAVQQASGDPVTVLSGVTVKQQLMGMRLLEGAADAGQSTSYRGTEVTSQVGVDGSVETVSQVWHQGGGPTLVETTSSTSASAASPDVASSDLATGSPAGVFGVTTSLVALLGKHYAAVYQGGGAAVGRAAAVVELYRVDGSLAARYWLDKQTMVPLRRELFDTADTVIGQDSFLQVSFGALDVPQVTAVGATQPLPTARDVSQLAWVEVSPARFRASLAGQGWRVPGMLPGGLSLYAAAWAKTTSGEVADLEYSDGLFVVSLFVQRGTLPRDLPGWRQVNLAGQQAFVSGHSVTWSGPGFVYTAIADVPAATVTQVVEALPSGAPPGVLDRLGRGFIRIAHLLNPFG